MIDADIAFEPGLFEPKSPLLGNGISRAETPVQRQNHARQLRPPGSGESPLERECVVGLRGLELRAKHAVAIEPVSRE